MEIQEKEKNEKSSFVRALVESAILIAIGTVLSLLKLVDLPYGGSITLASMLPIVLISYRHGLGWGMGSGIAYSLLQQLMGLKTLGYVTGWQSVVAVMLLDYVAAFSLAGLGGIFRKPVKNQALALTFGTVFALVLRFLCHVVSGATVWAGLSIPTEAALWYSVGYNASYMIPETVITALVAFYVGGILDFRQKDLRMLKQRETVRQNVFIWIGGVLVAAGLIFLTAMVFAKLQDPETGEFMITGLRDVNWALVAPVFAFSLISGVVFFVLGNRKTADKTENQEGGQN